MRRIPVPLPPLREQIRIADKLDALLSRVDAGRERLERVPKLVKQFRQAVLSAAVTGELTREWRGGGEETQNLELEGATINVPTVWATSQVTDLLHPMRPLCYGVVQPGENLLGGVPLIRVQDMERGSINVGELRSIAPDIDEEYRRSRVHAGDLLISVVGTIGRTAIVPEGFTGNIARAIARLSCESPATSKWLNLWLSTDTVQWHLLKTSREVARKTLNLSELAKTPVALPPLPEQAEIVRRVEALFAIADRLEARYTSALASFERLTPALLVKAFRGELVPQDPNDEPAAVLLERIRAQRAEGGRQKAEGKKTRGAGGDGAEPKRRGRPPRAEAEVVAEAGEPKRRGRPPKVRAEAAIPQASSMEDAIRQLQERGQQRAEGTRQVSLFDEEG